MGKLSQMVTGKRVNNRKRSDKEDMKNNNHIKCIENDTIITNI